MNTKTKPHHVLMPKNFRSFEDRATDGQLMQSSLLSKISAASKISRAILPLSLHTTLVLPNMGAQPQSLQCMARWPASFLEQ